MTGGELVGEEEETISNTDIARKYQKKVKICRQNNWINKLDRSFQWDKNPKNGLVNIKTKRENVKMARVQKCSFYQKWKGISRNYTREKCSKKSN